MRKSMDRMELRLSRQLEAKTDHGPLLIDISQGNEFFAKPEKPDISVTQIKSTVEKMSSSLLR